jgi:uncharacterized protein (DUF1015 family)
VPDIAPLRGLLYDFSKIDAAKVLAPPYDVISPEERTRLAAADPHNVVRLNLPESYEAAAKTLDAWTTDGTLKRDDRKAVYRYHQIFSHPDLGPREVTRVGFIAAVKLHPYADNVILPHERTHRGPKEDRLALMKATSAQFSQIFTMYRDAPGEVDRLFKKTERDKPLFDVRLADGVRHVLWRCNDAEVIGPLRHTMSRKKLYIADGHHRYETMLALREHYEQKGALSQYSSAQYGVMFLCNVDQPGLVILPTHRVLHGLEGFTPASFLEKVKPYFIVDKVDNGVKDPAILRASIAEAVAHQPAFAVAFPGEAHAWRLTLAPSASASVMAMAPRAVAKLDVTLLHGVVFEKILGMTPAVQEAQTHLRYIQDTASALAELAKPGTQAAFLLAPQSVAEVTQVSDKHEVMPPKSTFFFPKIASGVVINKIDPDEDLV